MADSTRHDTEATDKRKEKADTLATINSRTGRNMPQAVLTGAILVVLVVACLVFERTIFVALCIAFMLLAVWELRVDFATAGIRIPTIPLWICSAGTLLLTYFYPQHVIGLGLGLLCSVIVIAVCASFQFKPHARVDGAVVAKLKDAGIDTPQDVLGGQVVHDRMTHVSVSMFSMLYLTLLPSFLVLPLTMGHPVAHGFYAVFVPALGDIGGLFIGAAFGKHKLSPRISPKKSWEGMFGSMLFCTIGALCIGLATYPFDEFAQKWWMLVIMGIMVGVTGLFGDLCASMIKRDLGLKDMGHLLKGHGGVLDRVDSIIISAPFITAFLALCRL
ncbi:phosphatidate cytidylyltransferase [Pseudoscardovia suis]|uniref:phosphatidate cytidylyltransferase n=1 Tax=Pseudoscardovia suis TaxID=987063 RepID=UPI003F9DF1C9